MTNNIYSDQTLWTCTDKVTNAKSIIHGPLAEVLKKYPDYFSLEFKCLEPQETKQHAYSH